MQELFERSSSSYSTRRPNNLKVPRVNQTTYDSRSIKFEGARLSNHLPEHIKSAENLNTFKNLIKYWACPSCGSNYCHFRVYSFGTFFCLSVFRRHRKRILLGISRKRQVSKVSEPSASKAERFRRLRRDFRFCTYSSSGPSVVRISNDKNVVVASFEPIKITLHF